MSDLKMGEIISEIRKETQEMEKAWPTKLLFQLKRPFKWVAWKLWGRRKAIKRMKLLAGVGKPDGEKIYGSTEKVGIIDPLGVLESLHRESIKKVESMREPLPRPDVVDDPKAN